jgi:carbamoyl-phosphate synthase large subunit
MPKKSIKVLIIPAGSGMAVMAIKALKQDKDIIVMSADTDDLAPGLFLSHKGFLVPPFGDATFFGRLKQLVKRERVDVIIPALDTILLPLSGEAENFERLGVQVLVSGPETIKVTRDKWETYLRLKDVVAMPMSSIRVENSVTAYPLFIKPRDGSGSKEVYTVNSHEELEFFYRYVRNPIIQEFLPGKEYTVDCLSDMKGELVACVPRERIQVRDGICTKGLTTENVQLEQMAKTISKKLKFKGTFLIQAKEDKQGLPRLTEINARIGGTMFPGSFLEGNFHTLAVRLAMGESISSPKIRYGIFVTRYWEEIYLDEKIIKMRVKTNYLHA